MSTALFLGGNELLIFGYSEKNKILGCLPVLLCECCQASVRYRLECTTGWLSFFFIPLIPVRRTYWAVCPACGVRRRLSRAEAGALKNKIAQ